MNNCTGDAQSVKECTLKTARNLLQNAEYSRSQLAEFCFEGDLQCVDWVRFLSEELATETEKVVLGAAALQVCRIGVINRPTTRGGHAVAVIRDSFGTLMEMPQTQGDFARPMRNTRTRVAVVYGAVVPRDWREPPPPSVEEVVDLSV